MAFKDLLGALKRLFSRSKKTSPSKRDEDDDFPLDDKGRKKPLKKSLKKPLKKGGKKVLKKGAKAKAAGKAEPSVEAEPAGKAKATGKAKSKAKAKAKAKGEEAREEAAPAKPAAGKKTKAAPAKTGKVRAKKGGDEAEALELGKKAGKKAVAKKKVKKGKPEPEPDIALAKPGTKKKKKKLPKPGAVPKEMDVAVVKGKKKKAAKPKKAASEEPGDPSLDFSMGGEEEEKGKPKGPFRAPASHLILVCDKIETEEPIPCQYVGHDDLLVKLPKKPFKFGTQVSLDIFEGETLIVEKMPARFMDITEQVATFVFGKMNRKQEDAIGRILLKAQKMMAEKRKNKGASVAAAPVKKRKGPIKLDF